MLALEDAVTNGARWHRACQAIELSLRTAQRWRDGQSVRADLRSERVYQPKHRLTDAERNEILAIANSDKFGHLPPSQIVPRLADQGRYIASESSFYRVLKAAHQIKHRRSERPPQPRTKPQALAATAPNQLYSWDISYLPTTVKGQFFYLYMVLDVFSRKIVGWQVFEEESSQLSSQLIRDICHSEGVVAQQVTLHSDNGSPMKGATMLATLQQLGIAASFSRPAVSNDNPYSESLFKTLKYRPDYPLKPFEDLPQARKWVADLVDWYNHEHRHSSIRVVTPSERHQGLDRELLAKRHQVYQAARQANPARWTGQSRNWTRIDCVLLNPDHNPLTINPQQEPNHYCKKAA